ncbi:MAG: histidine kinase N-terminal 7TM domain-containing protein, partial [Anaerolineales bacterium]
MMLYYIYITFLIIGIIISCYLIARLWIVRKTPGATHLIWALACVAIWSFTYIFEIALSNPAGKVAWLKAEYLGIPFVCLAIFTFTLIYSGRSKWLTRSRFVLLLVIPIISFLMALTNDWHHLLWSTLQIPATLIGPITVGHGPWYIVNVVYSYTLFLLATFFLIQLAVRRRDFYRSQAIIMLVGMVIPWIGNVIYVFNPGIDWTPLAFTLTAIAFEIGFARFRLMDIMPITQSEAFNAMRDGIVVADVHGRVVEINPSAQSIFQKQGDQVIGQGIQELLPAWIKWNTETSTAFEIEHEIVFGEGPNKRTYSLRIAPILDHNGRINGHMAILTDITDQKLAQTQMLLQVTALEATENGIVITDRQGKIEWANPAFTRLTGYSREEVAGKNLRFLKSGKQSLEYYQNLWQTVLSGKVWRGELVNRRKDGSEYYEEMTITPLIQPGGFITNFIAIKQDISERKLGEEQLQQAHEQAVEANRMKTQLLASVSHDLRTPLGTILGYSEMLQTGILGPVNEEQRNAAAGILDSANRLLAFVNNLIGQAQLETGRLVIRPSAFKPVELVENVKTIAQFMT